MFPDREPFFKDTTGCILPENHEGHHKFIDHENRKVINWEDDENCDCGCHEEEGYPCLLFWYD